MSSNDKTRAKLLASMRKSKGETGSTAPENEVSKVEVKDEKTVEKKVTKPAAQKTKAAPKPKSTGTDPFRSPNRVWPD